MKFSQEYAKINERLGPEKQYHGALPDVFPSRLYAKGCGTIWRSICRDMGYMPEQVQDFYPTPATISTCMYYTGLDPRTMETGLCPKGSP